MQAQACVDLPFFLGIIMMLFLTGKGLKYEDRDYR
jgi:hypothetical protein